MFIVWRRRPVRSDRPAEFLQEYVKAVPEDGGRPSWRKRRRDEPAANGDDAWKPLWCRCAGRGRVAWTPVIMSSERVGGKPRQRLVCRLPTIRSCCLDYSFRRAAWWHEVRLSFQGLEQDRDLEVRNRFVQARARLEAQLQERVKPPRRSGAEAFDDHRRCSRKAWQQAAELAESRRRAQEEARRRAEEAQRRAEEAVRRFEEGLQRLQEESLRDWKAWCRLLEEELRRQAGRGQDRRSGGLAEEPWWVVMGLPPTGT